MNALRHRLRERCIDVYEWMDYRPDPDCRWLLAIPALLVAGWFFGSAIGLGIAVGLAFIFTLAVAAIGGFAIGVWIVANTLVDLAYSVKIPSTRTKTGSKRPRSATN